MDLADLLDEKSVLPSPLRRRPAAPGVVAALGHSEHAAQHCYRVAGPLRVDEVKAAHRSPISSLAKKAAAFRKISFSWRRVFTSRLSLRSSSFSSVVSPSRSPLSISSWLTQLRRVPSETPISRAILGIGCSSSEALTSRIASRRNSGGRPGLFVAMLSFPRTVLSLEQSTEPMQVQLIVPRALVECLTAAVCYAA